MTYHAAVQYLEGLVDTRKQLRGRVKISNDPVWRLLKLLGNPQRKFPAVYVSGTSGKGSVSTFLSSILTSAGYRTGLVLSPHVKSYTERTQVNGRSIAQSAFAKRIEETRAAILQEQKNDPSFNPWFFEVLVVAQFLHFAKERVDIAVIESGVGGPNDATNTCSAIVDVLTTVTVEHQNFLGRTVLDIARTESNGFHSRALRVLGKIRSKPMTVIRPAAGSGALMYGAQFDVKGVKTDAHGTRATVNVEGIAYPDLQTQLVGLFQGPNMAVAVAAIHQLRKKEFTITEQHIRQGMRRARILDRFEIRRIRGRTVVFDAAHNPEKMHGLVSTFRAVFPTKRCVLVFVVKRGKDVRNMLRHLALLPKAVVLTQMAMPCYPMKELAQAFRRAGYHGPITQIANPQLALRKALALGSLVLVTGSLYLYHELDV